MKVFLPTLTGGGGHNLAHAIFSIINRPFFQGKAKNLQYQTVVQPRTSWSVYYPRATWTRRPRPPCRSRPIGPYRRHEDRSRCATLYWGFSPLCYTRDLATGFVTSRPVAWVFQTILRLQNLFFGIATAWTVLGKVTVRLGCEGLQPPGQWTTLDDLQGHWPQRVLIRSLISRKSLPDWDWFIIHTMLVICIWPNLPLW